MSAAPRAPRHARLCGVAASNLGAVAVSRYGDIARVSIPGKQLMLTDEGARQLRDALDVFLAATEAPCAP